ncbi:conserved Plasmodium protein, unknown function [Plasmodium chabaudi chabaudi]|uniref:Uncharacterized protein n=1 Tax=Plasmodium chabaudi chabaudi TaxID=31271 RepID=A0A1C6XJA0_PLACU|nr:conserved Plasmodium protein, unknown function [Plasmodium chabaudi chabaudi]
MSTGWNFNFGRKYAERRRKEELNYINIFNQNEINNLNENPEVFREGLNCGPAGRNALLRWIEYNYRLKNDKENSNPAVRACKVWRQTQSFQDVALSGLMDFLKFLNIPKHITYKHVFKNYLSPKFINKVKSVEKSQKCLTKLAKKMMLMFQVREIQPLFSMVLDKINIIPIDILKVLVEDTPAAKSFYEITSINVKRKIWILCPELFFEEVEHIIEEIILRMKLKNNHYYITNLINSIIELIGEGNEQIFLYNLFLHIIRLKCLQSILNEKEPSSSNFSHEHTPCAENETKTNPSSANASSVNASSVNLLPANASSANLLSANFLPANASSADANNTAPLDKGISDEIIQREKDSNITPENRKSNSEIGECIQENNESGTVETRNMRASQDDASSCSSHLSEHFETKLKKLEIIFDKIMNNNKNVHKEKKKKKKCNNNSKLYVIKMHEYIHNSGSFEYLQMRENVDTSEDTTLDISKSEIFSNSIENKEVYSNINRSSSDTIYTNSCHYDTNEKKRNISDNIIGNITTSNNKEKKETDEEDKNKSTNRKFDKDYYKKILTLPFDNMFYSNLRLLFCLQYKEKYNLKDEEITKIDRYYPIVEFINSIIKDGTLCFSDEIKTQEIIKKTKNSIKIKNIDDLCEYSLLFNNILLKYSIINGICFNFYNNNFDLLTQKNNVNFWASIFYFGIYNNFFVLIKYAIDIIDYKHRKKKNKKIKLYQQNDEIPIFKIHNNPITESYGNLNYTHENFHIEKKTNEIISNNFMNEQNGYEKLNYEYEQNGEDYYGMEIDERNTAISKKRKAGQNQWENEVYAEFTNISEEEEDKWIEEGYDENNEDENIKNNMSYYNKLKKKKSASSIGAYDDNRYLDKEKRKEEKKNYKYVNIENKKEDNHMNYIHESNENCKPKDNNDDSDDEINSNYNNIFLMEEIKNKTQKLFMNEHKESYLKIPLNSILKYIITSDNRSNDDFFSFFNFFSEDIDNKKKGKTIKDKNSILLLSALLNIPQINYLKIHIFFTIIDEFFYEEKINTRNISADYYNTKSTSDYNENNAELKKSEENKKKNIFFKSETSSVTSSTNKLESNNIERQNSGNNSQSFGTLTVNNALSTSSNSIQSPSINSINKILNSSDNIDKNKTAESIHNENASMKCSYDSTPNNDKDKRLSRQKEDQMSSTEKTTTANSSIIRTNSSSNLYASQNKKDLYHIGDKLLRNIKDMNNEISRSYFFTNNTDMKCINDILNCSNDDEFKDSYKDDQKVDNLNIIKNEQININKNNDNLITFENDEKKRGEIYKNTFYFCEISNRILQKSDNFKGNSKIKKYLPYVLKTSYMSLNFLKQANTINIYIKYMYLYEYLYHMILNRILHISTINSFPFLQNVILKDLSYYYEDFKKSKIKNFWKFYLYSHTLIDMNKNNSYLISKLFHNNAIDYFIKLFYSLSFYNSIFSVLFLKMMETPLFYKSVEHKKTEVLQNLWIGAHELIFSSDDKEKRNSIEYKLWINSYNKLYEKLY